MRSDVGQQDDAATRFVPRDARIRRWSMTAGPTAIDLHTHCYFITQVESHGCRSQFHESKSHVLRVECHPPTASFRLGCVLGLHEVEVDPAVALEPVVFRVVPRLALAQ